MLHLLDGMGQIQGATTSATTYELSKTPITYDIPHREGRCPTSHKLILSGRGLTLDQPDRTRTWTSVVLHLLDGMGQIQGATTSATTYELSKMTPYDTHNI